MLGTDLRASLRAMKENTHKPYLHKNCFLVERTNNKADKNAREKHDEEKKAKVINKCGE